jgi:hypothetical protein
VRIRCFWIESIDGDAFLYRRAETAETFRLSEAPVGAMWDATWWPIKGPDGRTVVVRLPGNHDWVIDGRAANCAMPNDDDHRCWVRHGEPPDLTVDKCGVTCAAGAGSILVPTYHGFLRNGFLEEC